MAQKKFYTIKLLAALGLRRLRLISSRLLKNMALRCLAGFSRAEVEALGHSLYQQQIKPNLVKDGLLEIARRKEEGYAVLILSGAFNFILSDFCQENQIPHCYSARVAFQGDTCLGCLEGAEMLGPEKLAFLKERPFAEQHVDWAASCAYSDDLTDLALLQRVGQPFLVGSIAKSSLSFPAHFQRVAWE